MLYTVLSTSGWQGASWHIAARELTLAAARDKVERIASSDARDDGYITRIVRSAGKPCDRHDWCRTFSLGGRGPAHLIGRRVHAYEINS